MNYEFTTWKFQAQNTLRTCWEQVVYTNCFLFLFWHSEQFMYTTCSELGIFMYWNGDSMNNPLSYFGLVDARISASEEDLPVPSYFWIKPIILLLYLFRIFPSVCYLFSQSSQAESGPQKVPNSWPSAMTLYNLFSTQCSCTQELGNKYILYFGFRVSLVHKAMDSIGEPTCA